MGITVIFGWLFSARYKTFFFLVETKGLSRLPSSRGACNRYDADEDVVPLAGDVAEPDERGEEEEDRGIRGSSRSGVARDRGMTPTK